MSKINRCRKRECLLSRGARIHASLLGAFASWSRFSEGGTAMQKHVLTTALSAILLCSGGAAVAQDAPAQPPPPAAATANAGTPGGALDEAAIKSDIANAGYKKVKGLKFKDGVWQAKARRQ
jgi:hypothetical protein